MSLLNIFYDTSQVIKYTTLLISVNLIVSNSQLLSIRERYSSHGLFDWKILRCRDVFLKFPRLLKLSNLLFDFPGIVCMIIVNIVLSTTLFVLAINSQPFLTILVILILIKLIYHLRNLYGIEGSDQVTLIVLISLAIAGSFSNPVMQQISLMFIGLQVLFSYFMSGISKLFGYDWLKGNAISKVLSTRDFGHEKMSYFLRKHLFLSRVMTRLVVFFEIIFPFLILAPTEVFLTSLGLMFIFHLSTAVFMGLNNFLLAFSSTYPSLIYIKLNLIQT